MNLPNEIECANNLKELVLKRGLRCKCNDTRGFYWHRRKACFECKNKSCKSTIYLKTLTGMKGSKLPFNIWLGGIYLYATDKNVTPTKMQAELGHLTYSSMWELLKRIKALNDQIPMLQERYKRENDTNLIPNHLLELSELAIYEFFLIHEPIEVQNFIWDWIIGF